MENRLSAFDFQAEVGLTKHPGGFGSTQELAELCHLGEDQRVLDLGCGVGVTPCYLAKEYGCRVVGVDVRQRMIDRSNERAEREGLADRVSFQVASATDLPFEDDYFDTVISESVAAMVEDKQRMIDECVRVAKRDGYVGLNESTWLRTPPPADITSWVAQDLSDNAELLSADGWEGLLTAGGLKDIVVHTYPIEMRRELRNIIKRQGWLDFLRVWARSLTMYIRQPEWLQLAKQGTTTPKNLFDYFGYGLYVGRKGHKDAPVQP